MTALTAGWATNNDRSAIKLTLSHISIRIYMRHELLRRTSIPTNLIMKIKKNLDWNSYSADWDTSTSMLLLNRCCFSPIFPTWNAYYVWQEAAFLKACWQCSFFSLISIYRWNMFSFLVVQILHRLRLETPDGVTFLYYHFKNGKALTIFAMV